MTDYCSWVPTVGGRLSFSIIGEEKHNKKADTVNVADNNQFRYIVCHQHRDLLDSAIPIFKKALASFLYSMDGGFEFLMIAKAQNDPAIADAYLEGKMCFFPSESESWKNVKGSILQSIETLEDHANEETMADTFGNEFTNILFPLIESNSCFFVDFSLSRAGIVNIAVPKNISENDQVPLEFINRKNDQRYAVAQLFFFLKDISHVHQHHHDSTDTIIDIHLNDNTWKQHVIRSLYRKVLRFKRSATEDTCLSSLGVLAYLRAFIEVVTKKGKDKKASDEIQHLILNDENICKSIQISLQKAQTKRACNNQFRNNLRTVTISVFGLFLSIIGLAGFLTPKIRIQSEGNLISTFMNFTLSQPLATLGITLLISIFVLLLTDDIPYRYWGWPNDLVRLGNTFKKKTNGVLFLLAISFSLMTIALIFLASYIAS